MPTIAEEIVAWMADRANNALFPGAGLPAFDTPLIGVAAGADPIFDFLRHDIGPQFYWTPEDAFARAFPDDPAPAGDLSVIAWVLPQTAATRADHRACRDLPSLAWSRVRHYGEMLNEALRRHVVDGLAGRGVPAVAPTLLPAWDRRDSPRYGFASNWSERHTAYACGLGTFGLSDGLITPAGKAVRVGSVVARCALPVTKRPYTRHDAWCLRAVGTPCKACIRRCPAGAISEAGHDKVKCMHYIRGVTGPYVAREQMDGIAVNSCGLCQVGTPCEAGDPTRRKRQKAAATDAGA
ncbi:MAG: 4Fe-4S ferredoxin [Solidesulfovibrio sp. DCME]|uniref:4Fe-4S ferredoxin n=1 Tax=Solidesulfovibrio sp. DCME TaxID=3447380 RepID=UPI003D0A122E